ncbi:hypothetical protein ALQ80_200099 [Pseudomonas coronafaciens pv. oryzae]|nr:hypothetical protein ALQ80_200099 [Pseudomonas coronafaciens pv. oryzae]
MGLSIRIGGNSLSFQRVSAVGLRESLPPVFMRCYRKMLKHLQQGAGHSQHNASPCPAPGKAHHMDTVNRSAGYWFMNAALCSGPAVNQSAYEPLGKITTMRFSSWGLWYAFMKS